MAINDREEELYHLVEDVPCYVLGLTKDKAKAQLQRATDGTFLLRFSERTGNHCLSMKCDDAVRSFVILQTADGKYTLDQETSEPTVLELIRDAQQNGFLDKNRRRIYPKRPEASVVDENLALKVTMVLMFYFGLI